MRSTTTRPGPGFSPTRNSAISSNAGCGSCRSKAPCATPARSGLSADATATALWIPPGGTELSAAQESELEQLLTELLGADADRLVAAFQVFTDARPTGDDFYYLTMLGTDPQHRGHGHGLRLLHDTLQTSDRAGACAYLEASNPANVDLYARFGFRPHSTFQLPRDGPQITTMWRGPR